MQSDAENQLELSLGDSDKPAEGDELVSLPILVLTEEVTPTAILIWWDEMVEIFTQETKAAEEKLIPLRSELAALKNQRTIDAQRRKAQLRAEQTRLLARAEAAESQAYTTFEKTIEAFAPQVIRMMRREGVTVEDDDEEAVADSWDCLQRPAIEWCSTMPLREVAHHFYSESAPP